MSKKRNFGIDHVEVMYHVFCPSGGGNVFFAVVKFYRQEEEEEVSGLKKAKMKSFISALPTRTKAQEVSTVRSQQQARTEKVV